MSLPIQRRKISELVLEEIKKMIKDGKFEPNTKLPTENELAKMFNVSRSPVREAISVLSASGLVETRQGGGNWVRQVNFANMLEKVSLEMVNINQVFDLLELREIIESEAASLAAERYKQKDIEELESALNLFRQTILEDDTNVGDEIDFRFHQIIVKASYNPFLIQTIDNIADLYHKAMKFSLMKNVGFKVKREQVFNEHKLIYEAIKDRDAKAAFSNMRTHLRNARIKLGDTRFSQ